MKTYMGPKRSHSLLHVGQGTWASNVVHDIGPQKVVGRSIDTRSSSRRYEKEMRGLPWDFGWQKRPRPPRPCCPALFMRGLYASAASSKPLFFWEAYAHWRAVLSLVLSVHLNSFRIQGEYEKTSLQPTRKMCVDKHKKRWACKRKYWCIWGNSDERDGNSGQATVDQTILFRTSCSGSTTSLLFLFFFFLSCFRYCSRIDLVRNVGMDQNPPGSLAKNCCHTVDPFPS